MFCGRGQSSLSPFSRMKVIALLFTFALTVAAQPADLANQVKTVHLNRVPNPPKLEDFLKGTIPPGQTRIDDFRQNAPSDGARATRETVAYLSNDDEVAVFLDTFHDRQHVIDFYVNPFGIQADATSSEGQHDDYSYDTLW